MKILYVDDHEDAKVAAWLLEKKANAQVVFAGNGKIALQIFKEQGGFDAVITDGNMPEMDGAELAKAIHELNPAIKIALVSGSIEQYQPLVEGTADCFDKLKFPFDNPLGPLLDWLKE